MNKIESTHNRILYLVKALSIFSVVAAHMCLLKKSPNIFIDQFLSAFGIIGVGSFYILSGYFLNNKRPLKEFWIKKTKTIIIPWIFCGSIFYMVSSYVLSTQITCINLFRYLIGFTSLYYFITVLLIFFIIFRIIHSKKVILMLFILGATSMILTSNDLLNNNLITPFLNILNWICYFILGIFIKKYDLIKKYIILVSKNYLILLFNLSCLIIIITIAAFSNIRTSYWSPLSIPIVLIGFITFFSVSIFLSKYDFLIDIGVKSFPIYLIHIFIVGFINARISTCSPYIFWGFIKPIIGLLIVYSILKIVIYLSEKMRLKPLLILLGCR